MESSCRMSVLVIRHRFLVSKLMISAIMGCVLFGSYEQYRYCLGRISHSWYGLYISVSCDISNHALNVFMHLVQFLMSLTS